jgi:hypothetical protein
LIVAFALASVVSAQPGDLYLPPDFSQVRPGLPETAGGTPGGAYCGPTSAADLLQWLHDNGFPDVTGVDDVDNDEAVTIMIGLIGLLMGTDPDSGTSSAAMIDGLRALLDDAYPGIFEVGFVGRSSDTASAQRLGHRFDYIVRLLDAGYLVIANVGWYVQEPDLPWADGVRCGGHYVAMTGYDFDGSDYTARYRDPAREVDTVSTKAITDGFYTLMDADDIIREDYFASSWNWMRDPNDCSIIFDRWGIQDNVLYLGGVRVFSMSSDSTQFAAYNLATGQQGAHAMAPGGSASSMVMHPYSFDIYHCRPIQDEIFVTDIVTNDVTTLPTMAPIGSPRRLAMGYDETLYIAQGDPSSGFSLLAIRADGTFSSAGPHPALGGIACGDQIDGIYWWEPSSGTVLVYVAVETGLVQVDSFALPPDPSYTAPGYLAVDDAGTPDAADDILFYNHQGSAAIFRYAIGAHSALTPVTSSALTDPADMVVDHRGHLYVAQATTGPVLEFDGMGQFVSSSPAAALMATERLAMIRASRRPLIEVYTGGHTNADPPMDDLTEDCNDNGIPDEIEVAEGFTADDDGDGIPDECECPADIDGSGAVGFGDLLILLASWGPCPTSCSADLDGDGAVTFTDLLTLLAAWGPCGG